MIRSKSYLFGVVMKSFVINGSSPLSGTVSVSGSKNAALPILFASILTEGISKIDNLPDIGDVRVALDILAGFGATVERQGSAVFVNTSNLSYSTPDTSLVSRIRASTYLIGACLSRFGVCDLMCFGGCNFSARPIDLHILAAKALGAELEGNKFRANRLVGGEINLTKPSVGATVNAILLGVSAEGETVIRGFAKEPHIDSLIDFLLSSGAEILRSEGEMRIFGRKLHGGSIKIPGDMIEAGTFLALGAMSEDGILINGCPKGQISSAVDAVLALGGDAELVGDGVIARRGKNASFAELVAAPYPGFPTDLQPIFAFVMACLSGGIIRDTVWQSRFGYLDSLKKFGVNFRLFDGGAEVFHSQISPSTVTAPDLRGGMACIAAALAASGESVIRSAETVERGYENLCQKLVSIGANVRVSEL